MFIETYIELENPDDPTFVKKVPFTFRLDDVSAFRQSIGDDDKVDITKTLIYLKNGLDFLIFLPYPRFKTIIKSLSLLPYQDDNNVQDDTTITPKGSQ